MISFSEFLNEGNPKPWGALIGGVAATALNGAVRHVAKTKYGIDIPHDITGDAAIAAGGASVGGVIQRLGKGVFGKKPIPSAPNKPNLIKPDKPAITSKSNPIGSTHDSNTSKRPYVPADPKPMPKYPAIKRKKHIWG